eukprot:CCRYP_012682-RA/>CCRYP_012682-RA protein AED:0.35 eAED:0.34 QI:0/-1/0/1/-1/1/1/0/372
MLAPLTSLVGECGHTKVTKAKKTKKRPWYWDEVHQIAFDNVKAAIAKDVVLAYPDFSKEFEIYTDASSKQLGSVVTQGNRPLAFFSRKLSVTQQKYSATKIELLAIVETLKEFKGILWGQQIKVYTDHKNLIQDALGLTSDRVYRWRLLLEEYGPEIVYIKGIHNTVADAISRLDSGPTQDDNANWMTFTKCWCHYTEHASSADRTSDHQENINLVFANRSDEDVIYPLTVKEIAQAQTTDATLEKLSKHDKHSTQLVEDTYYVKMAEWSSPKHFKIEQLAGIITTCSILDTHALKRGFTPRCIGKICEVPSDHMSKTVVYVKSTNDTSTSTGNSLLSLSSQTLGRHYVWTLLDHTHSKVKMGQKLTLCVLL